MSRFSRSPRGWSRRSPSMAATSPSSSGRPSPRPSPGGSTSSGAKALDPSADAKHYPASFPGIPDMRLNAILALFSAMLLAAPAAAQSYQSPPPPPALTPDNTWVLDLSTGGRVTIQLRPDVAPKTVERIKTLTQRGFYNGLTFHRVIDGFMAQGGDPKGDGSGGSDLPDLQAEFSGLPHVRGAVSAARLGAPENADAAAIRSAEDSASSQFFIMLSPHLTLDGQYTVFGRVIGGMNFVAAIEKGEPPANPPR